MFSKTQLGHQWGFPPLGEVLGVASLKQAIMLLSVTDEVHKLWTGSTKFPEEKAHHIFLTVVSL